MIPCPFKLNREFSNCKKKSLSEWRILRGNILLRAGFNKLADRGYLSGVNEGRGRRSSLVASS